MRPLLLKGHSRPLTQVIYSREGDLIFSSGKDGVVSVWYSDNGERLGTYEGIDHRGHNGAVYSVDVNSSTTRLLSAGADEKARIWDVETGKMLHTLDHSGVLRCIKFSEDDDLFLTVEQLQAPKPPAICVYSMKEIEQGTFKPMNRISCRSTTQKLVRAVFTSHEELNERIVAVGDDGHIHSYETYTGDMLNKVENVHSRPINDLRLSKDGTTFITASTDQTAKLFCTEDFELLKTYKTDRPLNTADISNTNEHILVGGGQDASQVTTTAGRTGKFESVLFQKIYETQIGSVKGHFGPINSLSFNPDGRSFVTGGEDGYMRICHHDAAYLKLAGEHDD